MAISRNCRLWVGYVFHETSPSSFSQKVWENSPGKGHWFQPPQCHRFWVHHNYRELLVQSKFSGEQMKLEWQQLFEHHLFWSKQKSRKLNVWYLQRKAINNSPHTYMPQEIVYHLLLLSLMLECMMLWWSVHQREALFQSIAQQVAGTWVLYC